MPIIIARRSCLVGGLMIVFVVSIATFLVLSDQPDAKLHLRHPDIFCLESDDIENAIGIVKNMLLAGILRKPQLSEGYPTVEMLDKDLYPVNISLLDEERTSYQLVFPNNGGLIELFYRRRNETEARYWPGFTIYISPNCRWGRVDQATNQRVVVATWDSGMRGIVEQVLMDDVK